MQDLFLDPQILYWVLLPIFVVMILVGVLRHYITLLLDSPPKPLAWKALREQRALTRGALLRANGHHLALSDFKGRKDLLSAKYDDGSFLKEPASEATAAPPNPLDPSAMEGMMGPMKKQMVMLVPNTALMGWINFFFSGFVVTKLPFPLTPRFKQMMQARIETQDMDVQWVSSLSWYILCLFGLNSIYRLILGDENAADQSRDMQQMNPMPGLPGAQQDFTKLYAAEKENLQLINHVWACEDIEERILKHFDD